MRATADPVGAGADPSSAGAGDLPPTELLGDLDAPVAMADRAGTVALLGAGWRVAWAVGAGDRWHVAAEEAAVRTRLVDAMPVTATAMRVPGGDVILRAAAVRDAAGRAVVLEFVNETPTPVSLALAVSGSIAKAQVQGSRLLADRRVALELDRTPGGAVAVSNGDVWRAVRAGPPAGDCEARSRPGLAAAALLVPLATGVPLFARLPVDGGLVAVRPPEQAAAGWLAVVARAASVTLPDEAAERAWQRGIAACILAAGGTEAAAASRAAVALDRVGLPDEADRGRDVVLRAWERSRLSAADAAEGLRALASRRLRSGRVPGLAELAGPLAAAAGDRLDAFTLEQVAAALEPEAPAAARDARRLLTETAEPRASAPAGAASARATGLEAALRGSAAFGGDGLLGLEALLDCLVAEASDHLVIAPALPREWIGPPVDVRSLGTRHGRLSFSVRWHGSRPALLWELVSEKGSAAGAARDGATLRCGLDPSWSAPSLAGEALMDFEP